MLIAENIHVCIGSLKLADGLSFTLRPGQITAILGPNGTGKSTLLKSLFGDIPLDSGDIRYESTTLSKKSLTFWRSRFGYMPQDIHFDISLTVIEVVLLGRLDSLSLRVDDDMLKEVLVILNDMGISHLANRDIRTLSGGQCQMVLFAQALMRNPTIMMLDEPVSALDLHHQHVLLEHLRSKTKEKNYISIMVLHDLNLAAQYADNLLVLKNGQLAASGAPEAVLNAELIEDIYNVKAQVQVDPAGTPFVRTFRAE
ncbi:ABC transporter ATP-binding protein [Vibrio salinus]|uniref:ABC transporter ATP-binding protein n=1 Tax=Vibrio salinus TaxID=2899784 RepID=UPI001E48D296|nr:ATP-binding cassette domain-containing protein [Vibrio salinus]MCE0494499.1 ATP-binding cassette domain-containing protein [Vibrio salinus]